MTATEQTLPPHHKGYLATLQQHQRFGAICTGMRKPLPPATDALIAFGYCARVDVSSPEVESANIDVILSLTARGRAAVKGYVDAMSAGNRE